MFSFYSPDQFTVRAHNWNYGYFCVNYSNKNVFGQSNWIEIGLFSNTISNDHDDDDDEDKNHINQKLLKKKICFLFKWNACLSIVWPHYAINKKNDQTVMELMGKKMVFYFIPIFNDNRIFDMNRTDNIMKPK